MVTTRRGARQPSGKEVPQVNAQSTSSQRGKPSSGRSCGVAAACGAREVPDACQLVTVDEGPATVCHRDDDATGIDPCSETAGYATTGVGRSMSLPSSLGMLQPGASKPTVQGNGCGKEEVLTTESSESPAENDDSCHEEVDEDDGETDDHNATDDDSEDNDAIFSSNAMGNLASSLKAALQACAGVEVASPEQQHVVKTPLKLGLTSDPEAIQWHPVTKRPKRLAMKASDRPMDGIQASKEKDLAQQLMIPPRVKTAEGQTSENSKEWFQLSAPKITDELKQELRLLRLRGAYDPKRFYKSFDDTKFPKHFQIGTVLDNPQDFYSSRLVARERGTSITQELLSDRTLEAVRRKRYAKMQDAATRYQKVKKRKTELVRKNPKPKRPKH